MNLTPRDWIDGLSPDLTIQASLLRGLLSAVEAEERWEWLELGCSVAEGRGDELSDLDLALGHAGDEPPPQESIRSLLDGLGSVVDASVQPWSGHQRWWALYESSGQIDLLVMPAALRSGRAPGSVVLLDRSGRLEQTATPRARDAQPKEPRQWLLDGWEALSNAAKYLQRGSPLECLEQLHRTRTRVFQLWAVGEQVPYPGFGLTSLLDDPRATLPDGITATYPGPTLGNIHSAALTLADLLERAGDHAEPALDTPARVQINAQLHRLAF